METLHGLLLIYLGWTVLKTQEELPYLLKNGLADCFAILGIIYGIAKVVYGLFPILIVIK